MRKAISSALSSRPVVRSQIRYTNHPRIITRAMGSSTAPKLNDQSLFKIQAYVNGQWVDAKSGKTFAVFNPATGKEIGTMPEMNDDDTQAAIDAAAKALPSFRRTTGRERARMLRKWYQLMMDNADDLAKLITWENGKPTTDAKGEVTYAANFFEWFSEEAPRNYGDTIPASVAGNRVFTVKEPVGVCGLITPYVHNIELRRICTDHID
jgi:succinate-semialdehyde dehydrogenase / glutarate-semialdehyde dehydrogenase